MTPEEAISRIKAHMEIHKLNEPQAVYTTEALNMAICALKEVQQYREMNRKLREAYGDCDGLLETAIEGLCRHSGVDIGNPIKARLLTDEDVDKWENYLKIGTVEECREAMEKQKPKKAEIYTDTIQTMSASINRDVYLCPVCGEFICNVEDELPNYCSYCGQAINDENLEVDENE